MKLGGLRICMVTEAYAPYAGGTPKRYSEICKRLAQRGHYIEVFTIRRHDSSIPCQKEEQNDNLLIHRYAYGDAFGDEGRRKVTNVLRFTIETFLRLLNMRKYDLIECNHWPQPVIFPVKFCQKFSNIPLIISVHEVWGRSEWSHALPLVPDIGYGIDRFIFNTADHLIAVSSQTCNKLVQLHNIPRSKITVIPNGINLNLINSFICEKEPFQIICISRFAYHKRIDILLRAFAIVHKENPQAKLVVIGSGPLEKQLHDYAKKMGVFNYIKWYKELPYHELIYHLKRSQIFALPSFREGQSISSLEAIACGTPPIVFSGVGVADVINGYNGIAVKKADLDAFSKAIIHLLQNPGIVESLRTNGIIYARNFDWEKIVDKVEETYQTVVAHFRS